MEIDNTLVSHSQTYLDHKTNEIFELISNGDKATLESMITNQDFQFWTLQDCDGFTCLVKSAFLNQTEISLLLIETAKKSPQIINDINILHSWINKKAENGFNALHYTAFRGNVKILEKLIENGADINIKNNNGLSVMHMAAQGDKPNVLVYFKEKHGLSIDCLDSVNSTPLHWCSYMGSEFSMDYLVKWGANLNSKDSDGFTPLHLAVMTGEHIHVIKIKLLY
jgi:ankyrin repeat protein